ncbi:MAG: hypothetical protein KGJ72_12275 [Gammaproteobacteria bacterium]|nr:hypothetical protein [Gammaproteobacteria bacterium]
MDVTKVLTLRMKVTYGANMVRAQPKRRRCGRTRTQPGATCRGKRPVPRKTPLDDVILHLRHLQSAVIVAIAALRRQNCELDEDIASLLQRAVCDSLADQLQKLEAARRPPAARMRRA